MFLEKLKNVKFKKIIYRHIDFVNGLPHFIKVFLFNACYKLLLSMILKLKFALDRYLRVIKFYIFNILRFASNTGNQFMAWLGIFFIYFIYESNLRNKNYFYDFIDFFS